MASERPQADVRAFIAYKRIAVGAASAVFVVALIALLYTISVHASPGNSDGATVILEGQAFGHGNLTLNHWALSLDSFWLVDVPLYAVAVLIGGIHPQLLHVVPAIVAAAVIVLGAWMAKRGRTKLAGATAVATVVVLLGLPTHAFAEFFLMGPLHVTTTLWCLIAFTALRRGRYGWGWWVAVGFLAAGILGDFQTVALGVAPVGLAGVSLALSRRRLSAGLVHISAALASLVLTVVVRLAALAIGTFTISRNPPATLHEVRLNLPHLFSYGAALAGIGFHPFGSESVPPLLEVAHAVGLGVVVAAVLIGSVAIVLAAVRGYRADEADGDDGTPAAELRWLDEVLLFGCLAGCGVFLVLSLTVSGAYGRYLTSAMVFGVILAGRLLGALVASYKGRTVGLTAAAVVFAAVTAGYAATVVSTLEVHPPVQTAAHLAHYLERHHLDDGIGAYWSSSIVTVESSGRVQIRPVIASASGDRIVRYTRQSSSQWYGEGFQFLVFDPSAPWGSVNALSAIHTFGLPAHVAKVGPYRVYSWKHPLYIRPDGSFAPQPTPSS